MVKIRDCIVHTKKRGAYSVTRFTIDRPSHCPVSRNEQRRKPHASEVYKNSLDNRRQSLSKSKRVVYKTPHEAFFVALFLTYS